MFDGKSDGQLSINQTERKQSLKFQICARWHSQTHACKAPSGYTTNTKTQYASYQCVGLGE